MTMRFDAAVFFDTVRDTLFNNVLSQPQVDGMTSIMREWKRRHGLGGDHRHLAYQLATSHHETAFTHQPIKEYGSQSYLHGKPYYPYFGRGFVQLTWEANYKLAGEHVGEDLVAFPDLALHLDIATQVLYDGMRDGWFTGKKLSDYFNGTVDDPYNARRIINGTDCARTIAGYHERFLFSIGEALFDDTAED